MKDNDGQLNCSVFVNSFVQAAEVMDRLRRESESRMKKLGFDFLYEKKQKLNKILRDSEEIRRLFEDLFLYGDHPIEEGLYDNASNYDGFLTTASRMSMLFVLIMDRVRTEEQEAELFDFLNTFPGGDVTNEEIESLHIRKI